MVQTPGLRGWGQEPGRDILASGGGENRLAEEDRSVSEGSLEDLRLELPPEDLARLVLGQRLHEHDPRAQLLVRRHPVGDVVDDGLLGHVAVLADHVRPEDGKRETV